ILPTGGIYRTEKAEKAWDKLLRDMEAKYGIKNGTLDVGRGKIDELADRIHLLKSETKWQDVFHDSKTWEKLLQRSYGVKNPKTDRFEGEWPELDPRETKIDVKLKGEVPVGQFDKLTEV